MAALQGIFLALGIKPLDIMECAPMPYRALIFVPLTDPHVRKWIATCWAYCLRRRYVPEAVVSDWADVRKLMLEGAADKVVVASLAQIDWLDVVDEPREPSGPTPTSQQRTGRM